MSNTDQLILRFKRELESYALDTYELQMSGSERNEEYEFGFAAGLEYGLLVLKNELGVL